MFSLRMYHIFFKSKISNVRMYSKFKNPFLKTFDVISQDVPLFGKTKPIYPEHVDIVIIGGGFIGSSVAYSLKSRAGEGLSVVVLEKDSTYRGAQNNISLGTLTQHFTLPENLCLSQHGAHFLRNIKEHLGNHIDIQYHPCNNLILACEKYAEKMEQNIALQAEYGVRNEILTTSEINDRYPWIKTHDIKLGCLGIETEGIFNPWAFLKGMISKSQELGATYINAEVIGFELEQQRDVLMEGVAPGSFERINKVIYKTPDNEEHYIQFAACILAAGDKSSSIGKMAKIGTDSGLLSDPIPIEERQYNIYSIEEMAKETGLDTPLVTDTSGLWLRRNGLQNNILCGHIPFITEETKHFTDEEYYCNVVQPSLVNRINCKNSKVVQLTTEKQDSCTYDETGILGPHPYHNNLYVAAGFAKQGCIHAPGLGRAMAELIIDSQFTTIDLSRFGFDRILMNEPLLELNIY